MAENTYTKLGYFVVGSNGSPSISFNNIPQTYGDLMVHMSARTDRLYQGYDSLTFRFNNDNYSANYTSKNFYGISGGSIGVESSTGNPQLAFCSSNSADQYTYDSIRMSIPNYTSSFKKLIVTENSVPGGANGYAVIQSFSCNVWSQTVPVTSLTLLPGIGSKFIANSMFTLYGVKNAVKATGGAITISGGYVYHTFTTSAAFTPLKTLSVDVLAIGGGGGSYPSTPYQAHGGGGAGGVNYTTSKTVTAALYPVIVGAGAAGSDGVSSSFANIVAYGGGMGFQGWPSSGLTIGSAGGAGTQPPSTGGTTTSGQGNSGGNSGAASGAGGGGGGAGAVGGNAVAPYAGGVGGAGTNTYSAWATATNTGASGYYAGGGGGASNSGTPGAGGAGGGGAGSTGNPSGVGTNGTNGTGGGGGGNNSYGNVYGTSSSQGGSGIVIIRYAV